MSLFKSLLVIGVAGSAMSANANTVEIMSCDATIAKESIYSLEPVYNFTIKLNQSRNSYSVEAFKVSGNSRISIGKVDDLRGVSLSRSDDGLVDSVGASFALRNLSITTRDISFTTGSNFNGSVQRGDALGSEIVFNGQRFSTNIGLPANSIKAGDQIARCNYLQVHDRR